MVAELGTAANRSVERWVRYAIPGGLFVGAALGWWWSIRMADEMSAPGVDAMGMSSMSAMSAAGFLVAWLAMMAAMMLPAVTPVVKLYARAAAQHRVAPLVYFVGGYVAVWMVLGVPAYVAWRALYMPLADGAVWAGRVAGAAFVAAGIWQVSPLKQLCLRHCRSPMSLFLRHGGDLERRLGATRTGAWHGLFCVGCCWAMFALLVAIGTMNIAWMLALTALIVVEKTHRHGQQIATVAGAGFVALGGLLVIAPRLINHVT
jgi:predicted metal-binding membrane protein